MASLYTLHVETDGGDGATRSVSRFGGIRVDDQRCDEVITVVLGVSCLLYREFSALKKNQIVSDSQRWVVGRCECSPIELEATKSFRHSAALSS